MELVSEPYTPYFLPYEANGTGGAEESTPCPILGKNSLPGIGLKHQSAVPQMYIVSEVYQVFWFENLRIEHSIKCLLH